MRAGSFTRSVNSKYFESLFLIRDDTLNLAGDTGSLAFDYERVCVEKGARLGSPALHAADDARTPCRAVVPKA